MSHELDRGPLVTYEITWMSGHTERIQAHDVTWPENAASPFGDALRPGTERVRFYGEIDGRWRLVLEARTEDIRTIRDMATESPDGAS